ncbi:MAG: hypothetical protein H7061_00240 [Bdellovibrionaceae bacterium]|nr:hypothetical protein [Bdellovibrio sp.]
MSINKILILILIASTVAFFGFNQKPKANRSLVRYGFAGVPQSDYTNRGLVTRTIEINLTSVSIPKDQGEETQIITADVILPFDFEAPLKFKWLLGEEIKLVQGELNGQAQSFKANIPTQITIEVRGFTKIDNRHIGFEIGGERNKKIIHGDSLLASRIDLTFENIVQNVERIKAEQSEYER